MSSDKARAHPSGGTDHTPTVPPTPAVRKCRRRQVIDMEDAVKDTLRHFLLDSTKRKLFQRWYFGSTERELQKIYTDPLFGRPQREQIEDVLREQVRLRISRKEAA